MSSKCTKCAFKDSNLRDLRAENEDLLQDNKRLQRLFHSAKEDAERLADELLALRPAPPAMEELFNGYPSKEEWLQAVIEGRVP